MGVTRKPIPVGTRVLVRGTWRGKTTTGVIETPDGERQYVKSTGGRFVYRAKPAELRRA
jgi:hypothetical protein